MSRRITYFLFPGVALVALLLLAAPRIFADDGPKNPPARQPEREDPAARDARLAAENVIERDMAAKQPEFIAKLRASGTDFDTLDRVNLLVTTLTQESLDAAVRTSSAVVRGSVVGQDFDEKRGVVVSRLAMAETLAGPGQGKELTLAQVGGPMLNAISQSWCSSRSTPLCAKARSTCSSLRHARGIGRDGEVWSAGPGSQYEVTDGRIRATYREGLGPELDGMTVGGLRSRIAAIVR